MSEGFRLRVRYEIRGRLAYLSHLETIRSMERVVRRAGLPFAVTEGFSPHMKVAFGPALPVGAGSAGEYLDIRLQSYIDPEHALKRLQLAAPRNLMPLECFYVDVRADAIDVTYPLSVWKAEFCASGDMQATLEELRRAFGKLLEKGYIEVIKKKGRTQKVKQVAFEGRLIEGPEFAAKDAGIVMRFSTFQGNEGALRPDKFIDAALALMETPARLARLTRQELRENG